MTGNTLRLAVIVFAISATPRLAAASPSQGATALGEPHEELRARSLVSLSRRRSNNCQRRQLQPGCGRAAKI